jgi:hypothetical protein
MDYRMEDFRSTMAITAKSLTDYKSTRLHYREVFPLNCLIWIFRCWRWDDLCRAIKIYKF